MMELRNYEENARAGQAAASVLNARASQSGGGPISAERPFPPGMEYEQSAMGVIPVNFVIPSCTQTTLNQEMFISAKFCEIGPI